MVKRLGISLLMMWILTGCTFIPTNIVNEISLIQGVGYDFVNDKDVKGTIVFPIYKKDKSSETEVKSAIGESSKDIRTKLNNETRSRLVSGQLRLALYGKDLAKYGINDYVDTINRDPSIGSLIQMAIVDGDTNELLNSKKYQNENISLYLQEMLDQNMEFGQIPQTNLQSFLFQLFQEGQDPYLPIIKNVEENIKITGLAIFDYDKYVTYLPEEDVYIFKSLVETHKSNGMHTFNFETGDKVILETLKSEPDYKISFENDKPKFSITLKMKTRLQEFAPTKEKRQSFNKEKYQLKVEKEIEKKAIKIISQFKEYDVDPLGLEAKYREKYRKYNEKQWKTYYKDLNVSVKANVQILQTGTID
ncbi:Ger(x)C family spore germination protein [Metabacillus idriensis]|uniref:Ger(x)C family spore germination protein n=1 Tax=Metabacillus idriensis TaxID=324768 RepID=UPI002813AD34|nr:Ger(x)C family spore germination protein [Metabacillus idriensis]MDR0140100.1 Ger(x)C family spore germination protein [Metabacillus idriensis]